MTTIETLDQYMPIAVETLSGSERADFDLFLHPGRGKPLLFRSRSVPLAEADLKRLASAGVKTLLIGYADRSAYEEHLHARVAADGELSLAGKYALCAARPARFSNGAATPIMCPASSTQPSNSAREMADLSGRRPADPARHVRPDDARLLHLHPLGQRGDLLRHAGPGAGLFPIGPIWPGSPPARCCTTLASGKIPRRVLNAPQKLTPAEREIIQRHPQIGFEELSGDDDLTWSQLMMVYQHHERLDGRGYPVGIVADEIDPWAKICAVGRRVRCLDERPPLPPRHFDCLGLRFCRTAQREKL